MILGRRCWATVWKYHEALCGDKPLWKFQIQIDAEDGVMYAVGEGYGRMKDAVTDGNTLIARLGWKLEGPWQKA